MTYKEIVEAMRSKRPVLAMAPGKSIVKYAYVSGIIYRANNKGEFVMSVEMTDYNKRSVTITKSKYLAFAPESVSGN